MSERTMATIRYLIPLFLAVLCAFALSYYARANGLGYPGLAIGAIAVFGAGLLFGPYMWIRIGLVVAATIVGFLMMPKG